MGKGCKVVVCGLLSVGKTAILEQLLYGNHTIGMEDCETMEDVYMASVETDRGVKEQITIVVLGNKIDLSEQRQVDAEVAQQWARSEKVRLWEVTVTDRRTLIEPFTLLASKLSQPQSKSSFPLPGRKNKGNSSSEN
ncbi:PREDICTED: NF-kappa-B inhibitor-interacting Ras-like protein 1 isoform X3 [Odobenus rosmarus divergens]|uniref:NF-kappa-B inhibitor-interacting Ras-like protein 1 isoform X3 n=1 Tax=Odobenus rosmarus divergens TaxID=9708 RepID=A0A2U3X0U0_ODORO|nr:PREDICTED: NF-kappa-B inhibitor-interacting Ras-like protein 1 isoform X3 [Odobenus rosmarus divergens]